MRLLLWGMLVIPFESNLRMAGTLGKLSRFALELVSFGITVLLTPTLRHILFGTHSPLDLPYCMFFSAYMKAGGKDRRCHYNDGDSEDLSLAELQTLALMDPQVTKNMASSSTNSPPKSGVDLRLPQNALGVNLPLPEDGSVYRRCELVRVLSSFPKRTRERKLAIIIARERGFAPISERNIYKLLEKAERGDHIEDTDWHALAPKPVPGFDTTWEKRFNELKEYKHKHGYAFEILFVFLGEHTVHVQPFPHVPNFAAETHLYL